MRNKGVESSKEKVVAWGMYLVNIFKKLGISSNKVIKVCHIGRKTFRKLKNGKIINTDAYVRMVGFVLKIIKERKARGLRIPVTEEELKEKFWQTTLWVDFE